MFAAILFAASLAQHAHAATPLSPITRPYAVKNAFLPHVESATHDIDETTIHGHKAKGRVSFKSALNRPDGPQGVHMASLWDHEELLSFRASDASHIHLEHAPSMNVPLNEGDIVHLDALSAQHVRHHEDAMSVPSLHYRIVNIESETGELRMKATTTLEIVPCALSELFESLDMDVTLDFASPRTGTTTHVDARDLVLDLEAEMQPTTASSTAMTTTVGSDNVQPTAPTSSVASMVNKAFKRMNSIGSKVSDALKFATAVFNAVTTGNLVTSSTNSLTLINYHYDTETAGTTCQLNFDDVFGSDNADGVCTNCYAYTGLSVTFAVNINDYVLNSASVKASGGVDISVKGTVQPQKEVSMEKQVMSYESALTLRIGGIDVPVVINTPVTMALTATSAVPLGVNILVRTMVNVGLSYDRATDNDAIATTNRATFKAAGSGITTSGLGGLTGDVTLALGASPWVKMFNLGGPLFSLTATPELGINAASGSASCTLVSANVGVEGSVGGKLVVKNPAGGTLLSLKQDPIAILNTKRNVYTGCMTSLSTAAIEAGEDDHMVETSDDDLVYEMGDDEATKKAKVTTRREYTPIIRHLPWMAEGENQRRMAVAGDTMENEDDDVLDIWQKANQPERRQLDFKTVANIGTVYNGVYTGSCSGLPPTLEFSAQVAASEVYYQMELVMNMYAASDAYTADAIGNYIFDLYGNGDSTLRYCSGSACTLNDNGYNASTGPLFVFDPSLCKYDETQINCEVFSGCGTIDMVIASLPTTMTSSDMDTFASSDVCPMSDLVESADDDGASWLGAGPLVLGVALALSAALLM